MKREEEQKIAGQPAQTEQKPPAADKPAQEPAAPAKDGAAPGKGKAPSRRRAWLWRALTIICAAVFVFSASMVVVLWVKGQREEEAFRDLAAIVHASQPAAAESSAEAGSAGSAADPQSAPAASGEAESAVSQEPEQSGFAFLRDLNEDLFGWLTIEGTGVDYPVMFTPDSPEYYLRRDFQGSWAQSGVPFLDGAWTESCGHYLLYGHNMDNGTMFAPILGYRDKAYFDEHPVIEFETADGPGEYAIFAVFYSQAYPVDAQDVFRYYYCLDLSTQEAFDFYVSQARAASVYDTGVVPVFGETILTLSTCSYHTDDGRFVVAAVRR